MKPIWHLYNKNFKNSKSESSCLNILCQEKNVFVMDNHLAAAWCWLHILEGEKEYNFCHIDQHDDLANDNHELFRELYSNEKGILINDYTSLVAKQAPGVIIPPCKIIRWDNYILHTKAIRPNWFTKEIYACHQLVSGERCSLTNEQEYEECFDIEEGFVPVAIHPQNIICYDLNRSLEESLNNDDGRLWIINLDIDYFFNNKSQMFSSEYINSVCDQINRVKEKIAVVTIALSPECCGGWDNSIKVYNQIAGQLSIDMRL